MEIDKIKKEAEIAIKIAKDLNSLEEVRLNYLGKKGAITEQLKNLSSLPIEKKKEKLNIFTMSGRTKKYGYSVYSFL